MKNLNKDYFNPFFSHIYVEKSIRNHARTKKILSQFPSAQIIEIDHYKDVFCRSRQSSQLQHHTQKLILAARQGTLLYEGAPVCQSFGHQYFYYASCVMNCVYDCEYCYLKGMYPSANIVVFVNLEDYFAQIEQILKAHSLYLCVSYDTDLLALEKIIGYVQEWCTFATKHDNLKIEIRTKCANKSFIQNVSQADNVIYAFTLSPQAVIDAYEHHTASLADRLSCAAELIRAGCPVRLCFDPMIYIPDSSQNNPFRNDKTLNDSYSNDIITNGRPLNDRISDSQSPNDRHSNITSAICDPVPGTPAWKQCYAEMLEQTFLSIDMQKIVDVSVGTFRISQDYLKNMRKQEPESAVIWFPFQKEDGYCHYPDALMEQMESFLAKRLEEKIPKEKIFRWKPHP